MFDEGRRVRWTEYRSAVPVFDVDPENAPWWTFFVILGLGLVVTAVIGLAMVAVGDNPTRGAVRLLLVPVVVGIGYAMKRLFGVPRTPPPKSD